MLDWQSGLEADCARLSRALRPGEFDAVIDAQGRDEQARYRSYREITADSLRSVLGLPAAEAERIGAGAGRWPLYPDSREALRRLLRLAPCAATTNSDLAHGEQVQAQLGFPLSGWLCAEETRRYKPDPEVWREASRRFGVPPSRDWWHVSAYADYDLAVARELGLTTVFVERRHARPGPADHAVPDLAALADLLERA